MNMKKIACLAFLLAAAIAPALAQNEATLDPAQEVQIIYPRRPYAFTVSDTMWAVSDEAFTKLLKASQELLIQDKRIALLQEKIQVGEERAAAYDQMVALKNQEIAFWENQARELQSRNVDLQLQVLSQKKLKGLAFLGGAVLSGAVFLLAGN